MASSRVLLQRLALLIILWSFRASEISGRPFTSENNPPEVSETNILLRPLDKLPALDFQEKVGLIDGYYVVGDIKVSTRRQAVRDRAMIWPGGVVPYVLDKSYSQETQDHIKLAMREIEGDVGNSSFPCIRFVPRTTELNYLEVRSGDNCNSVVGLENTGPQISTFHATGCAGIKNLVVHELMHTLGLYHEQDRFDRDNYIDLNTTNIQDSALRDYVVKNSSQIDTLNTPYDFGSIMHYDPYAFAKDLKWPVMMPKKEYAQGVRLGQRDGLSRFDVLRVQRLYHCPEDTTHITSDASESKVLVWCDFDNGISNFTTLTHIAANVEEDDAHNGFANSSIADRILWITTSNPTPDGPKAGFTNGIDRFFYASVENCEEVSMDTSISQPNTRLSQRAEQINTSTISVNSSDTSGKPARGVEQKPGTTVGQQFGAPTPHFMVNVSLITPTLEVGSICLDFRVFQQGPTSHLEVYAFGPLIPRTLLTDLSGDFREEWRPFRSTLSATAGIKFQLAFVAVLDQGSVALDDIHIFKGPCV